MSKVSKFVAVLAALPVLAFATPVFAASAGQLGGGDNYVAKNLTKGGAYGNATTAGCNDTVQYSMQLTNTQFTALQNVTLKVSLPSQGGESTATATTDLGGTSGTTDKTTVTLSSGATQKLVNGSTKLYDGNGQSIKTLPDTVATSGVNIGTLNGSTTNFVNFQVKMTCEEEQPKEIKVCVLETKKVETIKESEFDAAKHSKDLSKCDTPETPKEIKVCRLSDKEVVMIKESEFDAAKYTKDLSKCDTVTPPAELPKTGAAETVAVVLGAIVAGTVASRLFLSRLSRQ